MRFLLQFAGICFAGAALGLALNAASARPVHLLKPVFPASASGNSVCTGPAEPAGSGQPPRAPGRMALSDAVAACQACTVGFVDARGAAAFAQGHIPGAVHLPPAGHYREAQALAELRAHGTVVVYDSGGGCGLAEGVAERLAGHGFTDVRLLEGSWTDWEGVGGPALSGACNACEEEAHSHAGADATAGEAR